MKSMYTAVATATGGRNGQVKSDNGVLDLEVRAPKAMGGANDDFQFIDVTIPGYL